MPNNNPDPNKPTTAQAGQNKDIKSTVEAALPYILMAIGAILILVGAINRFTVSGILLLVIGYVLYKSSKGELGSLINNVKGMFPKKQSKDATSPKQDKQQNN